jgi:hypothetical protein
MTAARVDGLLERMGRLLEPLVAAEDPRRFFLAASMRTTASIRAEIADASLGGFPDPAWAEAWDVAFADLYLDALVRWDEDGSAPGPWQVAFAVGTEEPEVPPLRHVVLGMHAHRTYDLPQALLLVIDDEGFGDPHLLARRAADLEHADAIVAARAEEEARLLHAAARSGDRTALERTLAPLDRGARRFLAETRSKGWRNARVLNTARRQGPASLKVRLDELGARSAERVADLRRPGQPLLRLSARGSGVLLEGA